MLMFSNCRDAFLSLSLSFSPRVSLPQCQVLRRERQSLGPTVLDSRGRRRGPLPRQKHRLGARMPGALHGPKPEKVPCAVPVPGSCQAVGERPARGAYLASDELEVQGAHRRRRRRRPRRTTITTTTRFA